MPPYEEVKLETLELLDEYSEDHDISIGYLTGKYSASTKLDAVGINKYVRTSMTNPTNKRMRSRFPDDWDAVGASDLEPLETIGAFIECMCEHTGVAVPSGEPK